MPDFFNEKEKIKWDENTIEDALKLMVSSTGQKTMPTHKEINEFFGNYKLSNAIRRNGGTSYWAQKMGLEIKECESKMGENYEDFFVAEMLDEGFDCERANIDSPRFPYDAIVESSVKVDVKSANKFLNYGNSPYYSFNLEKRNQTCDFYVCYCVDKDENGNEIISKFYTIPANVMHKKNQLAIGMAPGKYEKYMNTYAPIFDAVKFFESL